VFRAVGRGTARESAIDVSMKLFGVKYSYEIAEGECRRLYRRAKGYGSVTVSAVARSMSEHLVINRAI
jgi:hypothetical protein